MLKQMLDLIGFVLSLCFCSLVFWIKTYTETIALSGSKKLGLNLKDKFTDIRIGSNMLEQITGH